MSIDKAISTKKEFIDEFLRCDKIISGIYEIVLKEDGEDILNISDKPYPFYCFKYKGNYQERLYIFPDSTFEHDIGHTYSTYTNIKIIMKNYECGRLIIDLDYIATILMAHMNEYGFFDIINS